MCARTEGQQIIYICTLHVQKQQKQKTLHQKFVYSKIVKMIRIFNSALSPVARSCLPRCRRPTKRWGWQQQQQQQQLQAQLLRVAYHTQQRIRGWFLPIKLPHLNEEMKHFWPKLVSRQVGMCVCMCVCWYVC